MVRTIIVSAFIMLVSNVTQAQNSLEKERADRFREFCNYLAVTDINSLDTALVSKRFLAFNIHSNSATKEINEKRLNLFHQFCKILKRSIAQENIANCDIKLAYKFNFADSSTYSDLISQAKDQIYVRFSNTHPDTSLGLLYFAKDSDKLLSWIVVKESDTYTFFNFH